MPTITMIIALLIFGMIAPQSQGAEPHKPIAIEPAVGILMGFEDHFLVAIGENHGHEQLYEWLELVLRNPEIQERVDDIVVEYGNSLYQDILDRYIAGEDIPFEQYSKVWRNTVVSPNTVWDCPVYELFFRFVRELNATLPKDQRYRVIAGDPPVDWSKIHDRNELKPYFDRPAHFSDVVEREVLDQGRRALLIAGGGHFTRVCRVRESRHVVRWAEVTIVAHLELRFPGSTYVVQSMARAGDAYDPTQLEYLPRGALVEIADTWLGALPANGITTMRNYDGTPFTLYGNATFADMVDAIIYWGPESEANYSEPSASIYRDDVYWAELSRRSQIVRGQAMDSSLRDKAGSGESTP